MRTPEGKVKDDVKAYFKSIGACTFMPVQIGYGRKPLDFIACVPIIIQPEHVGRYIGVYVEIETKRGQGGRGPTARQQHRMRLVKAAEGFTGVVRSVDELATLMCKHFWLVDVV